MTIKKILLAWGLFLFALLNTTATASKQADYPSNSQMAERLQKMSREHPDLIRLQTLTQTEGGKSIWLLTIGTGDIPNKPALAIVGGVAGDHLLGSELALQFAEKLLDRKNDESIKSLLDRVSFYVFPDMSPDAREQYFRTPRYERLGNASPSDLDRDGRIGEDPYNDLNADGLITMMRVEDPTGEWMHHPDDERVLVKARMENGERGMYLLFSEGIDEDKDGRFNEDGEEGVFFNRNFSFNYPVFTRGSGEHAVSEHETRAIADFLFEAKNVFAVISFGEANNLRNPLTYNEKEADTRIFTSWKQNDIKLNQLVSNIYNKHLGEHAPQAQAGSDGDFFQWAYFHYGRFSFSTQGWQFPGAENKAKEGIDSKELRFLHWADTNGLENVFVPWTAINHPDFPGKKVEAGGLAPFVMKNPPYAMVDSIAEKHTGFILELAALHPRIAIFNPKTEKLGKNLHRITVDIVNEGGFPTTSQAGEQLRWMQKTVLRASLAVKQKLMSGKPIEVIGVIEGHSSVTRSWLVHGSGTFSLKVGAESTGFDTIDIKL